MWFLVGYFDRKKKTGMGQGDGKHSECVSFRSWREGPPGARSEAHEGKGGLEGRIGLGAVGSGCLKVSVRVCVRFPQ